MSGMSRTIVVRSWPRYTASRCSMSFSRSLSGFTSAIRAYRLSSVPHSAISFAAVFSPTPGTPGMLSVGSPLSAL